MASSGLTKLAGALKAVSTNAAETNDQLKTAIINVTDAVTIVEKSTTRTFSNLRADATATFNEVSAVVADVQETTKQLSYETFRTLNATEFNLEDYVTKQREQIEELRRLGLGEYLDAYAAAFERSRRGSVTPQLSVELSRAMEKVREIVRLLGGAAGGNFNFGTLESELNKRATDARDGRHRVTSGTLGRQPPSGQCGAQTSLSILRSSGAIR